MSTRKGRISGPVSAVPLGFSLGAIGLQLRTSEITRIAQVLLHEGTWGSDRPGFR
jgi:hypothetical protein